MKTASKYEEGCPAKRRTKRGECIHTSIRAPRDYCSSRQRKLNARAAATVPHPSPDPMTTAEQGHSPPSAPSLLLKPVLGTLPAHLMQQEVLRRLGPRALASLAGAGRGCAAAVAATALMQWARREKLEPLLGHIWHYLPSLCLKEACSYAARCGNREVLEWLHNTGCPWDTATASAAASGGHLDVLKLLHNHGCLWDAMTCAAAARFGHREVLQWARRASARLPVEVDRVQFRGSEWAAGGVAVGAGERRDRQGLERASRAYPRHWTPEAGGANVDGWAQCAVRASDIFELICSMTRTVR